MITGGVTIVVVAVAVLVVVVIIVVVVVFVYAGWVQAEVRHQRIGHGLSQHLEYKRAQSHSRSMAGEILMSGGSSRGRGR